MLLENNNFETGGGSATAIITHAAAPFFDRDLIFNPDEHKKPREHIFDAVPSRIVFRRPLAGYWTRIRELKIKNYELRIMNYESNLYYKNHNS